MNIGDYPSSPDFASLVRYGGLLQEHHACGRMLVYYFNEDGTVIQSDQDFAIQVPLETLKQCPNIIGVCSANTSSKAVKGAFKVRHSDPLSWPGPPSSIPFWNNSYICNLSSIFYILERFYFCAICIIIFLVLYGIHRIYRRIFHGY